MVIDIKNVSFSYGENSKNVLKDINVGVKKGEAVLLCGASGCGKSTLLQLMNGIIPEQREGQLIGEIHIHGEDAKNQLVKERSKIIGSVFQNPKSQFFHLNTTDELFFGAANHLVPLDEIHSRLDEIAKSFDIEALVNRHIFKLSGGEKQRIACASVALNRPQIYLLDEPSSNLDEESIEKLTDILKFLKSQGATIVIAEHRLYYALTFCDKVMYMKDGEIVDVYKTKDFMAINEADRKQMGLRSFSHTKIADIAVDGFEMNDATIIENMQVHYGKKNVLDIGKMVMPRHKVVAIVGDNGVGKSTFVRAFTGLIKTKGAKINGSLLKAKKQQKESFMVMQDVNSQLYCESVLDELVSLTDESEEILSRARKVLEKLNLLDYEEAHPMVLSGGQKQRTAIATGLFLNKKYLIFDEPTSGLDYDNMIRVSHVLKELKTDIECLLVITHDTELIENCADYVIRLEKGVRYDAVKFKERKS